jgi:hypothetical protein
MRYTKYYVSGDQQINAAVKGNTAFLGALKHKQ